MLSVEGRQGKHSNSCYPGGRTEVYSIQPYLLPIKQSSRRTGRESERKKEGGRERERKKEGVRESERKNEEGRKSEIKKEGGRVSERKKEGSRESERKNEKGRKRVTKKKEKRTRTEIICPTILSVKTSIF